MLLRGVLRAGFRVGVFFLLDAQITLLGVLLTACGLVTVASMVYGIYQYSTDPVKQLHSKQIALTWGRQIEREEDMDRQKRGLGPLSQDERNRRQAPLEREIAEFEALDRARACAGCCAGPCGYAIDRALLVSPRHCLLADPFTLLAWVHYFAHLGVDKARGLFFLVSHRR